MDQELKRERHVLKYSSDGWRTYQDEIATEYPLTIMLNGEEFATMVCTPSHIEELVIGFLASEGIILLYEEVMKIEIDEDRGYAYVQLQGKPRINRNLHSKRFIGSCCGKSRQSFYFYNDMKTAKTSRSRLTLTPEACIRLMAQMQEQSQVFKETGGVHNAALGDERQLLLSRTDIGRHNALDKLYGYGIRNKLPLQDKVIIFSGRISSEILLKVAKMGVGILLSKSAPTELALRLAEELQITTVGFIRSGGFNVYTHPHRITSAPASPTSAAERPSPVD